MRKVSGLVLALALLAGCGQSKNQNNAARSMEQIYRDEGVPVRVREVRAERFATTLTYTASLRGTEESVVSALVSDNVAEVRVAVGDHVEKDAVLVTFPADNPSLGYEQARVNFQNAEERYNRLQKLFNENGVSRQEYDNAHAAYEVARANWSSLRDMLQVRAPISGYVTRLNVSASDKVKSGDPLLTISNYDRLEGRLWVTDSDVGSFRVGLRAKARWQGKTIPGRVSQVDLAMDRDREAFLVIVRFDNSRRLLPSGVTADVEVETYVNEQAVVVRREDIVNGSGPEVYVVEADHAVLKPVETGREQGIFVEVLRGLRPGELQITQGIQLVSDGAKVRVIQ